VADLFDPTYGRKTATLGVDAPLSASGVRTGVPYSAIDPSTEYLAVDEEATAPQLGDATQLWRITHDGTQSHSIAFGGFDVQVVERARRDGGKRAPDPGELGWKDTSARPLESVVVAVRPVLPRVPSRCRQRAGPRRDAQPRRHGRVHGAGPSPTPLRHEVVNAPADLGFEAYWSIHLIGGEQAHGRPLVSGTTTRRRLTATQRPDRRGARVDGAAVPAARHPYVWNGRPTGLHQGVRPSRRGDASTTRTRPRRAGPRTSTACARVRRRLVGVVAAAEVTP
jgi:hypothetical protein